MKNMVGNESKQSKQHVEPKQQVSLLLPSVIWWNIVLWLHPIVAKWSPTWQHLIGGLEDSFHENGAMLQLKWGSVPMCAATLGSQKHNASNTTNITEHQSNHPTTTYNPKIRTQKPLSEEKPSKKKKVLKRTKLIIKSLQIIHVIHARFGKTSCTYWSPKKCHPPNMTKPHSRKKPLIFQKITKTEEKTWTNRD